MDIEKRFYDKMSRVVLVVDDEEINREILGNILSNHYGIVYAKDGEEAYDVIKTNNRISAVLLDLIMPKMDGFEVMNKMKEDPELSKIPIIVLTSDTSSEVRCLELGAVDFIAKPYNMPEVIRARVKRTIELFEDREVIRSTEKDELTGLLRKPFMFRYAGIIDQFHPQRPMDAVVLNISHFHLINEVYGRDFGDELLVEISNILLQYATDNKGIVSRDGADTFLLYVNRLEDENKYNTLLDSLEKSIVEKTGLMNVHIRMGIYCKQKDDNIEVMFDRANVACNMLRGNFQERIAVYDGELRENVLFSERLIHDMARALEEEEFKIYYQPKFNIQADEPEFIGAEALVRWVHPEYGLVPPGKFIPLFEKNGLIQRVDHYVWEHVASDIKKWKEKYGFAFPISVNVSRVDVHDPNIESFVDGIIGKYSLEPADIHLEITESAYTEDALELTEKVRRFRDKGFTVEMDDFGSGYSSLNVLTAMPLDVLKMDMKFVRNIEKDEKSLGMVQLIIDIAKFMTLPVIAEGVEDEKQYKLLKKMGCDMVQGYYFSKPMCLEDFEKKLDEIAKEI